MPQIVKFFTKIPIIERIVNKGSMVKKKINLQLYFSAILLVSFIFKVAIADYIKQGCKNKVSIERQITK